MLKRLCVVGTIIMFSLLLYMSEVCEHVYPCVWSLCT